MALLDGSGQRLLTQGCQRWRISFQTPLCGCLCSSPAFGQRPWDLSVGLLTTGQLAYPRARQGENVQDRSCSLDPPNLGSDGPPPSVTQTNPGTKRGDHQGVGVNSRRWGPWGHLGEWLQGLFIKNVGWGGGVGSGPAWGSWFLCCCWQWRERTVWAGAGIRRSQKEEMANFLPQAPF